MDPVLVDAWLKAKGISLWGGEGWDISDPKERTMAVLWFCQQINDLHLFGVTRGQ